MLQAVISRCSQPLSGFSARCLEDEQMLDCLMHTNPNASYMYVVDTRPRVRHILDEIDSCSMPLRPIYFCFHSQISFSLVFLIQHVTRLLLRQFKAFFSSLLIQKLNYAAILLVLKFYKVAHLQNCLFCVFRCWIYSSILLIILIFYFISSNFLLT